MGLILKLNVLLMFLIGSILVAAIAMPQINYQYSNYSYSPNQSDSKEQDYFDTLQKIEKNQTINVIFNTQYGNYIWGLKSKNGQTSDRIGGFPDANLIIKCNYSISKRIINSKDPIPEIIKELLKGNIIEYKPRNPFERDLLNKAMSLLRATLKLID